MDDDVAAAIAEKGQINMLMLIDHLEGWEAKDATRADYDFGTQQYRHVARCAFVSDKKWQRWMIKLLDPSPGAPTKKSSNRPSWMRPGPGRVAI